MFLFTACDSADNPPQTANAGLLPLENVSADKYNISNFMPMYENSKYEYVSDDDSALNYYVLNTFIKDNKVQRKFYANYAITDYVLEYSDDKVTLVYSDLNDYFFRDFTGKEPNYEAVILQKPFKLGSKWEPESGAQAEITGMDVDVTVPFGSFKAMEVTTKYEASGYELKEYYVNEIGLVKSIQQKEGEPTLTTSLKDFQKDYTNKIDLTVYYPNIDDYSLIEYPKTLEIKTNTDGLVEFEKLLKSDIDGQGGKIISDSTKILDIQTVIEQNGNDYTKYVIMNLSKEYQSEMNAGSGFESSLIQSLVDTVCNFTSATKLQLLIDGQPYASGHIEMGPDEFFYKSGTNDASAEDTQIEEAPLEEEPAAETPIEVPPLEETPAEDVPATTENAA